MGFSMTFIIIIVTGIISYRSFQNPGLFNKLLHWPYQEHRAKEFYRLLTAGFVHGSWTHLLINLFVLYSFGEIVEYYFNEFFGNAGRLYYLAAYILMIVFANIPSHFTKKNNSNFRSVGASGAVSGIIFIFILIQPWSTLLLFFVIPIPAVIAGVLFLAYSSWAAKNSHDQIDHQAHFYGALSGIVLILLLHPALAKQFVTNFLNGWPF